MMGTEKDFDKELYVLRAASGGWIGSQIEYFASIGSTNTVAMEMAGSGAVHGLLVVADYQESGRGRHGRTWTAPPGCAIAMSILLQPSGLPQDRAPMLTIAAAMAVERAIEEAAGLRTWIKWPNDIVCHGKKICGILTEMRVQPDRLDIVIGIGINVHTASFPEQLADRATSLYLEGFGNVSRAALCDGVCRQLEKYYEAFVSAGDLSPFVEEYDGLMAGRGGLARVQDPHGEYEGTALGINERGALRVMTEGGERLADSGEVLFRGIYGYL